MILSENADKTIEKRRYMGYDIVEIDNQYLGSSSAYKGIHLTVVSADGSIPLAGKHG